MKKRLLAIIAAAAMVVTMLPSMAFADVADTDVAKIGDTGYATLQGAVDAAQDGETVVLVKKVTLTDTVHIKAGDKVTIDLNGKTIDFADSWVYGAANNGTALITVDFGGDLTIEDSSEAQTGEINGYDVDAKNEPGKYQVYGAVMMTAKGDDASNGTAKLTVNGGTLLGTFAAIGGNRERDNTEIVINGGTIKGFVSDSYASVGIDHPQNGKLTVNGGYIEGMDGISMRSGTLIITGGTIVGTAPESAFENDLDGGNYWDNNFGTCTGHALQIVNRGNNESTQESPSVNITGGVFKAEHTDAVSSYASNKGSTPDTLITGFITGGEFNSDVSTYMAEGIVMVATFSSIEGSDEIERIYMPMTEEDALEEANYVVTDENGVKTYYIDAVDLEVLAGIPAEKVEQYRIPKEEPSEGTTGGEATEQPAPEEPAEDVEEAEDAVDTGDNMNMAIPFGIAGLALAAMAAVVATRRRTN